MRMTQPMSRLILVKMGDTQLGRISRNRMWALLAPSVSADFTKYSLRSWEASP